MMTMNSTRLSYPMPNRCSPSNSHVRLLPRERTPFPISSDTREKWVLDWNDFSSEIGAWNEICNVAHTFSTRNHFLDSFGRPRTVLCQTTGKFVLLQKFCVTAIVSSKLITTCHQPPGTNTVSPGFCRISIYKIAQVQNNLSIFKTWRFFGCLCGTRTEWIYSLTGWYSFGQSGSCVFG